MPVIGILTRPMSDCAAMLTGITEEQRTELISSFSSNASCFESHYVKWLEAGGVKVVPIRYNAKQQELDMLLNNLSGVFFTGGGYDIQDMTTTYFKTANFFFQNAIKQKSKKLVIWGTCMGFQLLNILAAQDPKVLTTYGFDSEFISYPLDFSRDYQTSRMISNFPKDVVQILATKNVTCNLHHDGILPATYSSNTKLNRFFRVISTNFDRVNREFLSTIEAYQYPIYGSQWHPERPPFVFYENGINHSEESIHANLAASLFLANEARKCENVFSPPELKKRVVETYCPKFHPQDGSSVYYFD